MKLKYGWGLMCWGILGCGSSPHHGHADGGPDAAATTDAPVDTAVDVGIDALLPIDLVDVAPAEILEGQGDGGSAPALVVIHGHNFADHVSVTLTSNSTSVMLTVDTAVVSADHQYIAVPVTAHVDPALTTTVALDVTVSEASGAVSATLPAAISLHGLPELTSLVQSVDPDGTSRANTAQLQPLYSRIDLTSAFAIPLGGTSPAIFRAVSEVRVQSLHADAGETAGSTVGLPGPGGCAGGAPGMAGGCAGGGQPGSGTGGGGGAGFSSTGGTAAATGAGAGGPVVGDTAIISYATNQPAGGGGGSTGGAGGGGGGVIELTAGGDVVASMLTANASNGGSTLSNVDGGGGAGGVVILRGGHYAGASQVAVGGGAGVPNLAGAGSPGRVRWDAPMGQAPLSNGGSLHRGLSFVPALRDYTDAQPEVAIIGQPLDAFTVTVVDSAGAIHPDTGGTLDSNGNATIRPTLAAGYNRICVTLPGASYGTFEADTCVSVAYLP